MPDSRTSLLLALPKHKISYFKQLLLCNKQNFSTFSFPVINLKAKEIEIKEEFLNDFDWIVFRSSFGAKVFFESINKQSSPNDTLNRIHGTANLSHSFQVATVGPSVSMIVEENNFKVTLQPKVFNSQALAKELEEQNLIQGNKFLLITGDKSNCTPLIQSIQFNKGQVEQLIVYESVAEITPDFNELNEFINYKSPQKYICLSSPEGVKSFHSIVESKDFQLTNNLELICLGPATYQTSGKLFQKNKSHCPEEYSYNGMIKKIKELSNS